MFDERGEDYEVAAFILGIPFTSSAGVAAAKEPGLLVMVVCRS